MQDRRRRQLAGFRAGASQLWWRWTCWPSSSPATRRSRSTIAERLPQEDYPSGLGQDLRGRALGCMAEALRLDQKPEAARATLAMAWEALDEGTADPLERAGLLRVQASLEMSLGNLAVVAADLRSAASLYRLYGDRHQEGRTLQKLALAVGWDDPAAGTRLAEPGAGADRAGERAAAG